MKEFLLLCRIFGEESIWKRWPACTVRIAPPALFPVSVVTELIVLLSALYIKLMHTLKTRLASCIPSGLELCELVCCCSDGHIEQTRSNFDPGVNGEVIILKGHKELNKIAASRDVSLDYSSTRVTQLFFLPESAS